MRNEITEYQLEKAKEQGIVEGIAQAAIGALVIVLGILGFQELESPKKEFVNTTKVVFENSKVICFAGPSIGTWCVDMTLEDVRMPLLNK